MGECCPGHGPVHLLSASAAEIGFRWGLVALAWSRHGLPLLSNLAGTVQHFRAAVLDAWRGRVAAGLCGRAGVRGGPLLDIHVSLGDRLLATLHQFFGMLSVELSRHAREEAEAGGGVVAAVAAAGMGAEVGGRFLGAVLRL